MMMINAFHLARRTSFRTRICSISAGHVSNVQTVPITVLSGFLGSGKTSLLNNILRSSDNKHKYGVIINDMASVNIDMKHVKSANLAVDALELQNGCVCCSLAEDMLTSVLKLMSYKRTGEEDCSKYDHIIIECSGVAEPRKMIEIFKEADIYSSPLYNLVKLDTLITLVDATVFLDLFGSDQCISDNPRLAAAGDPTNEDNGYKQVTQLLLEQTECADIIVINKCDLLSSADEVALIHKIVNLINSSARIYTTVRGEMQTYDTLIGSAKGLGVSSRDIEVNHKKLVAATLSNHDHSLDLHVHAMVSHDIVNVHDHAHAKEHDPTPPAHDLSHCHSHSHLHDGYEIPCTVDHSHSHSHSTTTAEDRFGITSFVYQQRVPFHPVRFTAFLRRLGKLSVSGLKDLTQQEISPLSKMLLRSKGFVWLATPTDFTFLMSHAGRYCEVAMVGSWWSDIPKSQWPELMDSVLEDFQGKYGDKRQELVFIGRFEGNAEKENLTALLDGCMLTTSELVTYDEIISRWDLTDLKLSEADLSALKEIRNKELKAMFDPNSESLL